MSEAASDYWFEISGLYSYNEKGSAINGGKQNVTASFKAGTLNGTGHDIDWEASNPTMVKGGASASGSGKVAIETAN